MTAALRACIYGARGSLPNPVAHTAKYGGATTCLGVFTPDGIPLVVDGGSGIYDLGLELTQQHDGPREIHIFFTHTHWDHVLGMPFFAPLYDPGWTVHLHALRAREHPVRDIFGGVYASRYFPVAFDRLKATVMIHELSYYERVAVGGTEVRCCRVNHPGYALGFRIDHRDRSLFFASDAAPFSDMLFEDRYHIRKRETDPAIRKQMDGFQRRMEEHIRGVDLLFFDANYTDDEYEALFHFGHASMTHAYELAKRCAVPRVVFWHHDRGRPDDEVDRITEPYVERGRAEGIVVEGARQGTCYELPFGGAALRVERREPASS